MLRAPVRSPARLAARRARRAGRVCLLVTAAVIALNGCATKRDLRDLRAEIRSAQQRQDSAQARLERLVRAGQDSLSQQISDDLLRTRADLARQLLAMEEELLQIQELTGQSQRVLAGLRDQLESRARTMVVGPEVADTTAGIGVTPAPMAPASADADAAYNAAITQFQRGSLTTARRGFEEFLRMFPNHNLAPRAQFMLAETYEREARVEEALREFLRVAELYPTSDQVPGSLFRAGLLELQRGNRAEARRYLQRVVNNYPDSDAAGLAQQKLAEIGPP
ncbi:MAG: tol-pal system protein YbgF [Gemmatimonadetes bacterium]|nr:tol-pal system protein YbgF [Gemmatimonadota bacterium]